MAREPNIAAYNLVLFSKDRMLSFITSSASPAT
jgi:hypothetical protein